MNSGSTQQHVLFDRKTFNSVVSTCKCSPEKKRHPEKEMEVKITYPCITDNLLASFGKLI